ncbi:MAG: glycerol-3-phosphate 1-O-acyltransferase PlsY [Candidatus Marinimicrobia bacterium]|nr:glycerol-3-phosphate 1-O-acyltransferase PlsY [Candidatus Neomarinimicrobiota bacterium]
MNLTNVLVVILAYLIGSFPAAWILGKVFAGKDYDIRKHGSGNVGATNVIRNLGWKAGVSTFLLDAFKGFAVTFWLPALMTQGIEFETARVVLAAVALIGHTFPIYISFRGGKAVATTAGVIFAFRPEIGLICVAIFAIVVLTSRQSGVGSIAASFAFPLSNLVMKFAFNVAISPQMLWFSIAIPFYIVFTHRENLAKIFRGDNKKDF